MREDAVCDELPCGHFRRRHEPVGSGVLPRSTRQQRGPIANPSIWWISGAASLIDEEDAWRAYIADGLVEAVPARDVQALHTVGEVGN